jgi:thiosulfate dehydrogenase
MPVIMKLLNSPWFPRLLGLLLVFLLVVDILITPKPPADKVITDDWQAPDSAAIPLIVNGTQIEYGRQLIIHTANYLGPNGTVAHVSNGIDCQSCHMQAGEELYGNSFAVANINYPQFSPRTGRVETIADRINSCMQRSLNGTALDSTSKEVEAMIAYIKWVGAGVTKASAPKGAGIEKLAYLTRAADPIKGGVIFSAKCAVCHGKNGLGLPAADGRSYTYPPLWGPNSYNVSAGMYRLGKLAGFIKNNMPYGTTYKNPALTSQQAWDVAAYIERQPRPHKLFPRDWPDIKKKPIDYPIGPYADKFTERQHQLGPFNEIVALTKK